MDIGNEKHQQFIKDFILSLHAGGDDGNPYMQSGSRSLSESSLNPNAAEFVPSYMKISYVHDVGNDQQQPQQPQQQQQQQVLQQHELQHLMHQQLQYQRMAPRSISSSSTTLVEGIMEATPVRKESKEDKLGLIQRRLYKLMNQLGNHNLPLLLIQFSLTPNGNGVNVQFLSPESSKHQSLDRELCQSACLRVDINQHGLQSTRPEFALTRQFLNRMGDFLCVKKAEESLPAVCSKCTTLGLKNQSYTELEIDRQIEAIKAFERLINEDEGTRYQDAFKQLCQKLGITQGGEQAEPLKTPSGPAQRTVKEAKKELPEDTEQQPRTEDNLSTYEWDPFIPEASAMKAGKPSASDSSVLVASEQKQRPDSVYPTEGSEQQNQHCVLPPSVTQGIACSTSGGPSAVHSKPVKSHPLNTQSVPRVASNSLKNKNKVYQLRYSLPAVVTPAAAATTTATAVTTAMATATAANTATGSAGAVGMAGKKPQEQAHINGSSIKRNTLSGTSTKSRVKALDSTSSVRKPTTNCKLEPRPSVVKAKPKLDNVHVNKPIKTATLPRAGGVRETQENKQQSTTARQRVMAPRSTHASQMRQTEVKRRLNLMRSDDTDVQLNEYLFK